MQNEQRQCQNCKNDFVIEPDDFAFYEKIQVPAPTWCPECRQQRRYAWRNERTLYRRDCDLCGKSTVTIYSPNKPYKVYCPPCWWGDGWDATEFGRDFDFDRPFFEQFKELQLDAPRIALLTKNSVNSDYTNHSGDNKNCYLGFGVFGSENSLYCTNMYGSATRDCVECYHITDGGELLFECIDCEQSYNCQYGRLLRGCNNCLYVYDCRGSSDCFMSSGLRNKQYVFRNEQLTKEEYKKRIEALNLGSHEVRGQLYKEWIELMKNALHQFAVIENSVNVTGSSIWGSRNVHHSFDADEDEDVKFVNLTIDLKTSYDCYHSGLASELLYENHGLTRGNRVKFTHLCYDNADIEYCDTCQNSQNLFGCASVKKGSHMIFNKKYSESEYKELRAKIIEHMKKGGEYGEYFPPSIAPVSYNETQGQVYMPLSKDEVLERGWLWEDDLPGTFGKETLASSEVADDIANVDDSITKQILACIECKRNFNIVEPELKFYRRGSLPIPRLCPQCRYARKIAIRPPRKTWHRQCMCDYAVHQNTVKHGHHAEGRCPNEFETPYEPNRLEVVYCKECYQAEVV